jgi:hypothetical protein
MRTAGNVLRLAHNQRIDAQVPDGLDRQLIEDKLWEQK